MAKFALATCVKMGSYDTSEKTSNAEFETCCKVQKTCFDTTVVEDQVKTNLNGLKMLQRIKTMKKALEAQKKIFEYGEIEHHFLDNATDDQPGNYKINHIGSYESRKSKKGVNRIWQKLKQIFTIETKDDYLNEDKNTTIRRVFEFVKHSWETGTPIKPDECFGCDEKQSPVKFLNRFIILMDFEVARRLFEGDIFGETVDGGFYPLPVAVGIACIFDSILLSDDPASCFDKYFNSGQLDYHMFTNTKRKTKKNETEEQKKIRQQEDRTERTNAIKKIITERFENMRQSGEAVPPSIFEELLKGKLAWDESFQVVLDSQREYLSKIAEVNAKADENDTIFESEMTKGELESIIKAITNSGITNTDEFLGYNYKLTNHQIGAKQIKALKSIMEDLRQKPSVLFQFEIEGLHHRFIKISRGDVFNYLFNTPDNNMKQQSFEDIIEKLKELDKDFSFKNIAQVLLNSSKTGTPIGLAELAGHKSNDENKKLEDAKFLNQFLVRLNQEAAWQLYNDVNHPVTVGIACMLQNIASSSRKSFEKYLTEANPFYMFGNNLLRGKRAIKAILREAAARHTKYIINQEFTSTFGEPTNPAPEPDSTT